MDWGGFKFQNGKLKHGQQVVDIHVKYNVGYGKTTKNWNG